MRPLIKNSPEWLIRLREERAKRASLEELLAQQTSRMRQLQGNESLWGRCQSQDALVPLGRDFYR